MHLSYKKLSVFILCSVFFGFSISPAFSADTSNTINFKLQEAREKIRIRLHERGGSSTPSRDATPTPVITPTNTVTPSPTQKATTPTPIKSGQAPTTTPTSTNTSSITDVQAYIMQEINKFRAGSGLPAVATSKETCDFGDTRAKEISTGFNHNGFRQRINSHTIPYIRWTRITENIAMTPNYKNVVSMWANSAGHAANMRADTPFVCVAQFGNYYAYEGMKP